jgi:hypothetical protein
VHIAGVTAYDSAHWADLFVATAGASAALAGLVSVAVSINIERILKFAGLPECGVETLVLLLTVLLVSLTGLIPGRSAEREPPALADRPLVKRAILGASLNAWVLLVEILR